VPPAKGPATALVVLLHGYGADGNDLIGLAPYLQPALPGAAFVAPNAPERIPGQPFGYQWFSLNRYDPDMLRRDPRHAGEIYQEMLEGADRARPALDAFLDAELARHNLGADRLALVGFSQGAMMALHVGLRRRPGPRCIIGLSGALVGADRLPLEIKSRPPVLMMHGDADPVVPVQALFSAVEGLGAAGVNAEWHISKGLGHSIDNAGLEASARFLQSAFKGV
jgi:phospholipase/carboxylesterase